MKVAGRLLGCHPLSARDSADEPPTATPDPWRRESVSGVLRSNADNIALHSTGPDCDDVSGERERERERGLLLFKSNK